MAREQVAGAIILEKLRERIVSGLYLGYWRSGERLPSIREIADAERVDRKTAAAAYRRLQEEGLVRVRARSGVYLCAPALPDAPGPLERLHRQWLEHTYDGARDLGLGTRTILRLIGTIAEIERATIPVVEGSWSQAEALATELRQRLEINATPYLLEELRPSDPVLADAPLLITTPFFGPEAALLAPGRVIVEATLAPAVLRDLRQRIARGFVVVVVESGDFGARIRRAFDHCHLEPSLEQLQIVSADDRVELSSLARRARTIYLWPGTPGSVEDALPLSVERVRPRRTISEESLDRIQAAILDAAIRRLKGATTRAQEVRVS